MMSCSLEWKNQSLVLVQSLNSLRLNDSLVDVTLAADGQFLKVHRLILCACSPYFRELLGQQCDKQAIVFMKDVSYQQLKLIVEYIYQGSIEIEHKDLNSFVQAAKSLQILGLIGEEPLQIEREVEPEPLKFVPVVQEKQWKTNSHHKRNSTNTYSQKTPKVPKIEDPLGCDEFEEEDTSEPITTENSEFVTLELEADCNENEDSPDEEDESHIFISDGRYESMEGKRKGSNLIADTQEGFVYRIRRYCGGKRYYRCSSKSKCPGRLVGNETGFHIIREHDHPGDKHIVANYKLVAACRNRAVSKDTPVDQIIKEELVKSTGISKVLVTNRYLWKARQYHRRRMQQRMELTTETAQ